MTPCPVCGGWDRVALRPGQFQCVTQRVVNVVPPGVAGNATSGGIPTYGPCGSVYDGRGPDDWMTAVLLLA
jgi:hypothetical protein